MKINCNVTGPERKKLVNVISEAIQTRAVYLKAPTMAYQIGPFHVDKNGVVEVDDGDPNLGKVISSCITAGFDVQPEAVTSALENSFTGSITITKEGMTPAMVENLQKIIIAKSGLIKKAFGVQQLPVLEESNQITFEWFPDMTPENGPAYMEFISRLRTLAMETKRVTMKEKTVENEKYAWRCFLLRLGFIGPDHKTSRSILMRNFSGSSSFKSKTKKETAYA